MNEIINIQNLSVDYGEKNVLENISLIIPKGVLCGIVGSNGSGKTTLMKSILELIKIKSGEIKIFDTNLKNNRQKIAYIPQRTSIDWDFPATVNEVVMMGRINPKNLFSKPTKNDKEIVKKILEQVGLTTFAERQISQLSGGQQQRTFLARALAQEAELYLFDEPFAGIDKASEDSIMLILKQLQKEEKTILIIHHDLNSIKEYFDYLILLNKNLVAAGKTSDIFNKENLEITYQGRLPVFSGI
ncbi:MAG: metal ABC transporter ATP-binding protein [Cytophagales bacterium]|nr:MAG: metal ABC transporter ATP-binding protein [Cytophagales bacterium]TAH29800.1 MAG: metal ABC transporter ATP-binding protein [Cytophagales bacterium]